MQTSEFPGLFRDLWRHTAVCAGLDVLSASAMQNTPEHSHWPIFVSAILNGAICSFCSIRIQFQKKPPQFMQLVCLLCLFFTSNLATQSNGSSTITCFSAMGKSVKWLSGVEFIIQTLSFIARVCKARGRCQDVAAPVVASSWYMDMQTLYIADVWFLGDSCISVSSGKYHYQLSLEMTLTVVVC